MTKNKKYRPGPLFTKIPGARIPKKQLEIFEENLVEIGSYDSNTVVLKDTVRAPAEPLQKDRWTSDDSDSDDSFHKYFKKTPRKQPISVQKNEDKQILPGFTKASSNPQLINYKRKGGPKTLYCSLCNEYFNQTPGHDENMLNHILSIHANSLKNEEYQCKVCEAIFSDAGKMRNHFDYHRKFEKPKQCTTCGKTFECVRLWRSHSHEKKNKINKEIEKQQFACEICGKLFMNVTNLNAHILNLHEQKGRMCRWCKRLISYENWEEHKSEEKIKHSINTATTCDICGSTFSSKDSAAMHRRNYHENRKPMECKICLKTFKTTANFASHTRTVHGDNRFECAICHYRKSYKFRVANHIQKKHKLDLDEISKGLIIEHNE
uniref:CSON013666 protein n=1 Tax=Culicoides sonorensis TaxID=179676 RepID=A0A336JZI8_CULSO